MRVRSESVLLSRTDLGSISLRTPSALMSKQWKHPEEGPGRHREPVTQGASWRHYHTSGFPLTVDLDLSHCVRFTGHFQTYSDKMFFSFVILLQRIHRCFRRAGCSGPQGKKKTRVRAATRWRNLFLQLDSRLTTAPAAAVLRGCCPDRQAEAAPRRLHPRKW